MQDISEAITSGVLADLANKPENKPAKNFTDEFGYLGPRLNIKPNTDGNRRERRIAAALERAKSKA